VTEDSPLIADEESGGIVKMKGYKWTFYGRSVTVSRYLKVGLRTAFLLNPLNSSPIVTAIRHLLPKDLQGINAFDDPVMVEKIIKWKLNLALMSSPKTPTLKEKLFRLQKGACSLCNKPINPDYLLSNGTHIHHINPIKKGGSRFTLKNLTLTHPWCHRALKH
jgi:hypothetical protein